MQRCFQVVLCALTALTAVACDTEPLPVSELDTAQRAATTPGNGDLAIHLGDNTSESTDQVWDIVDIDVHEASTGNLLLTVDGDQIFDADGMLRCSRVPVGTDGSTLIEELRDGSTGEVHYTVMDKWVFNGHIDPLHLDFSQLAYTFKGDQVYIGEHSEGDVLVTASEPIERASDMRKVVIASLIDGNCGAPGLP